jgi:hypothetical protein
MIHAKQFTGPSAGSFTALAVLAAAAGCSNRLPSSLDAGASLASTTAAIPPPQANLLHQMREKHPL